MFLQWLNLEVQNVSELLYYLDQSPPPERWYTDSHSVEHDSEGRNLNEEIVPQPPPPPPVIVIQQTPPSLFAVIIGINEYADSELDDLRGAVPDADAVYDFLVSDLHVPQDQIVKLRNKEATRKGILDAMQDLSSNPKIHKQDPILIFYAGHGGEAKAPDGWHTSDSDNNKIQMLIPHDFVMSGSDTLQGHGVFDRTLSRLLTNIAKNKSDNITVIFDCCYSGSGTRNGKSDKATSATRGVELPEEYKIPAHILGKDHSGERAISIAKGFSQSGLRSHVLLAACMQGQTAKERDGRGAFTSQLLGLLKGEGVDKLTYKDIITRMPDLPFQNPQCEGVNQNRILFNAKVASPHRSLFNITAAALPGHFFLEAGEAHGISKGAAFAIYTDRKMTELVGTVKTDAPKPFRTRCTIEGAPFSLSQTAFALQTHVGEGHDICLFIEDNDAFLDVFVNLGKEMKRTDGNKRAFRFVNRDENPDLAISTKDGFVRFHIMEQVCRDKGLLEMPFYDIRVDATGRLLTILRSAADFYWNLHHTTTNIKGPILTQKVSLECFKLVDSGEYTDDFEEILLPERDGQNLNVDGMIVIDVDEDVDEGVEYGYRINNNHDIPLYAALFYFDVSDLSISSYYHPGTAAKGKVDYSIPAGQSLTIGFGDSGTVPYHYYLRANQKVDIGFLKLYLTTNYVDFSNIEQKSPFEEDKELRASGGGEPKKPPLLWETLTIPVIQKRGAGSF